MRVLPDRLDFAVRVLDFALCGIFAVALCAFFARDAFAAPHRIVSLSPVGTEILYALGQGKNIVGVTKFCDYPPEARKKPQVGEYAQVNFEDILLRETDLLVIQDMHAQFCSALARLGIPFVIVRQKSMAEIYDSICELGRLCSQEKKAAALVSRMKQEVADVRAKVRGRPVRTVLLAVSRELSEPKISVVYAAGKKTFYNELIEAAGGKNIISSVSAAYPKVSQEGIVSLDPDVIIDLVGDRSYYHAMENIDLDKVFGGNFLKNQWAKSVSVKAVTAGRVSVLAGTMYLRPGPRLGKILYEFAKAVHPEVKW
ncbi:MAG: ABC transporter substrate-binding protein [Synergistes sp.]|nr:ABC transporter substrate-binding protein [Synergistes sp.]